MGFALSREHGETVIESRGTTHRIVFAVDRVRQEPRLEHTTRPSLKNGRRGDGSRKRARARESRVELNAMTPRQLLDFVEEKLYSMISTCRVSLYWARATGATASPTMCRSSTSGCGSRMSNIWGWNRNQQMCQSIGGNADQKMRGTSRWRARVRMRGSKHQSILAVGGIPAGTGQGLGIGGPWQHLRSGARSLEESNFLRRRLVAPQGLFALPPID